jgi:hypothetical protein
MGDVIRFPVDELELDFASTVVDLARSAPVARQKAVLHGMSVLDKMLQHAMDKKDNHLIELLHDLGYVVWGNEE